MKIRLTIAAIALSSLTACGAAFEPMPVHLTSVEPCTGKTSAENEGNCYFHGKTEEGKPIEGALFTMGEVGDWIILRCTPSLNCRATAAVADS